MTVDSRLIILNPLPVLIGLLWVCGLAQILIEVLEKETLSPKRHVSDVKCRRRLVKLLLEQGTRIEGLLIGG
jgi:hypothetical protein